MKIGIIGGGSVGLLCAYYLSLHHEVTVVTRREEQAAAIQSEGIRLYKGGEEFRADCSADMRINSPFDLLVVTVKQHQLQSVFPSLERIGKTNILFLQNGMGHIHDLKDWRAGHSIYVGIAEHGAVRKSDTAVEHTGFGAIKWSAFDDAEPDRLNVLLQHSHSDFPIHYETDWYRLLTGKLIVNACINPLTALLQVKNGELLTTPAYLAFMKLVFQEACRILRLENEEEAWERVRSVCGQTKENRSSMLVDVIEGRQTEADAIIGYLLKEARLQGLDAVHLEFLYGSIKALERNTNKVF
ncbi:2-dehydropantoate 2-reductase [Bacillus inaquosorum]|uniref:2-dehydropantoate 2-reductase n=1 Tax=Bacillus inaquosorum TaxID=483913 RepID=UPI00227E16EB|nr:2-dehydropantoate 2-reductase [Bacillus inaquosorum]MCY8996125.1 2-dehydropantoate 2-reductase [Bacillus inaquosorum]MCY9009669.1 2-dehydropantoate 2-reductase [Bacillus inaquosorum]MCY9011688.1 2-dehydropantoate 2-reductase [Bacillus inaquosorum]MCY9028825.1 2-dehydropantoate 2-reductase [Bacillus inaquosorum]MCY9043549.1 2-dehydropantoate 2-reductase [Bacillus inaquosorum]